MGRRARTQAEKVIEAAMAFMKSGAADAVHLTFSFGGQNVGSFSSRIVAADVQRRAPRAPRNAACSTCGEGRDAPVHVHHVGSTSTHAFMHARVTDAVEAEASGD